jgi:hypothetical protein
MIAFVSKQNLTVIAIDTGLEATAVRAAPSSGSTTGPRRTPTNCPDGNATLAFITNLFFLRTYDIPLVAAVQRAVAFHAECERFRLFS